MAAVTAVTVLSAVGLIVAVAAAAAFILRRIAQSALKAACNDQDAYPAASSSMGVPTGLNVICWITLQEQFWHF
jgi:hypothetical protein